MWKIFDYIRFVQNFTPVDEMKFNPTLLQWATDVFSNILEKKAI